MDNLISETNVKLESIITNLATIKEEYENKLEKNSDEIQKELATVRKYKSDFFKAKEKIEKMNNDIEGFEEDYQNLVDRFKDDELANILVAANKEISAKIEERKRKILVDRTAMNDLVNHAEKAKEKLVKLTAEKKALEVCLARINDSFEFYSKSLNQIIEYSIDNKDNLCACFFKLVEETTEIPDKLTNEDVLKLTQEDEEETNEDINEETSADETNDIETENDDDTYEEEHDEFEENSIEEHDDKDDDSYEDDDESDESESGFSNTIGKIETSVDDIDNEEFESDDEDDDDTYEEEETEKVNEDTDEKEVITSPSDEELHNIINDDNLDDKVDFADNFDLEKLINFDDTIEDDDSLYENNEN